MFCLLKYFCQKLMKLIFKNQQNLNSNFWQHKYYSFKYFIVFFCSLGVGIVTSSILPILSIAECTQNLFTYCFCQQWWNVAYNNSTMLICKAHFSKRLFFLALESNQEHSVLPLRTNLVKYDKSLQSIFIKLDGVTDSLTDPIYFITMEALDTQTFSQ